MRDNTVIFRANSMRFEVCRHTYKYMVYSFVLEQMKGIVKVMGLIKVNSNFYAIIDIVLAEGKHLVCLIDLAVCGYVSRNILYQRSSQSYRIFRALSQ